MQRHSTFGKLHVIEGQRLLQICAFFGHFAPPAVKISLDFSMFFVFFFKATVVLMTRRGLISLGRFQPACRKLIHSRGCRAVAELVKAATPENGFGPPLSGAGRRALQPGPVTRPPLIPSRLIKSSAGVRRSLPAG